MDYFGTGYFEPGYFDPGYFGSSAPTPTPTPTATGGARPSVAVILRRMAAVRAAAQGALRQTEDRVFMSLMTDVVAVEYDARAAGGVIGPGGSSGPPDWQPVVGFEAVPCLRGREQRGPTEGIAQPGEMVSGRWAFPQEIPVQRGYRLVYQDPEYGTRYLYVQDKAVPKTMAGTGKTHHWQVYAQDRPL